MTDTLPPFSVDKPTCIKCGHVGASTQYMAHGQCIHGDGIGIDTAIGYEPNERLHRTCERCDFAWDEAISYPIEGGSGA
jgi:hypothetical protein